ncbi:MAG: hypothetical protein WCS70_07565 [Verrucomicrobiota bacterium]
MTLKLISIVVGAAVIALRLPGLVAAAKYRDFMVKFPRNVVLGRIIMGVVAAIVWWIMYHAATDEWKWAQPFILLGVPVVYWLVYQFGTPYLSMRAVAALMLLIAKQMIDAADQSESSLRLIVTVYGYLWVVAAIWMASAPHHFRDLIGWMMKDDKRCRLTCAAGVTVGLALVALGAFVY